MRRPLCVLFLGLLVLSGCGRARSHVVYGGDITLEVANDLGQTVCYVYMGPSTDPRWGTDWLGRREVLNPGQVRAFGIYRPVPWDIRVTDCRGRELAVGRGLAITGPSRILLRSMSVVPLDPGVPAAVADRASDLTEGAVHAVYQTQITETQGAQAVVTGNRIEINQRILFESGSARILDESTPILTQLRDVLGAHPEIHRVQIEGHTDVRGNDADNLRLSQARAESVVAWLQGAGVPQTLEHVGFGETRPLCSDDTEECHQRNRRVDFVILERDEVQAAVAAPAATVVERALNPACVEAVSPGGTAYVACNLETNQPGARRSCREIGFGWDLATVRDSNDQAFVQQLSLATPGGGQDRRYWLGNNDLFIEGQYAWGDNTPSNFAPWCPNEPNNFGGGEDCVHTWPVDCGGGWNDVACSEAGPWRRPNGSVFRSGFVCERPADPSRAMARRRAEIWTSLVRQWERTPSAQGNHYLAACAATVFMDECGSETDTVTLSCIHQRREQLTAIIGQRCVQYGGMATQSLPDGVAQLGPATDAQVRGWNAEYADCLQRANPVEHYIADSIDQTCACMTTWVVDLCLAAPGATPQSAQGCVQGHRSEFGQVATACLQYGHLRSRR